MQNVENRNSGCDEDLGNLLVLYGNRESENVSCLVIGQTLLKRQTVFNFEIKS